MSEIIKIDQLTQDLAHAGLDMNEEVDSIITNSNGFNIPMIRVEHRESGKNHRLYIDRGEDYLNDGSNEETLGNSFTAVVFAEQNIRALWPEGDENLPSCAAIDNRPTVDEPLASNCLKCKEAQIKLGHCKPKIRLWIILNSNPYVFHLSPTSIKFWQAHKRKLKNSKIPVIAVNTVFSLKGIKRNGFNYAECEVNIDGVISRENLLLAKKYRDELNKVMAQISDHDFSENGDKLPF